MGGLSIELWLILGLIGAGSILSMLGRLAAAIEDEKRAHQAKIHAEHVRRHYLAQLAVVKTDQEDDGVINVDIVDEAPARRAAA